MKDYDYHEEYEKFLEGNYLDCLKNYLQDASCEEEFVTYLLTRPDIEELWCDYLKSHASEAEFFREHCRAEYDSYAKEVSNYED